MKNQLNNIKIRLIQGSFVRKTRFHDIKGNFVPFRYLLLNGPRAIGTCFLRRFFKYRPIRPWISYAVAAEINKYLGKESVVLEYGSGMSTIWLARRSARVFSIERNEEWFTLVKERLLQEKLNNVVLELRPEMEAFYRFPADDTLRFDLLFIDGGDNRCRCLKNALPRLKPGGLIFLDDTDKGKPNSSDIYLQEIVAKKGGELIYYTDFAPTDFGVTQCALARIP